jgi:hypothetical protein
LDLNRELSVRYGERFVPVREILIDAHDLNHAGDAADHAMMCRRSLFARMRFT